MAKPYEFNWQKPVPSFLQEGAVFDRYEEVRSPAGRFSQVTWALALGDLGISDAVQEVALWRWHGWRSIAVRKGLRKEIPSQRREGVGVMLLSSSH